MQLDHVNCNVCGSAIEIGHTTNFAVCAACGADLEVTRTDTSAFTKQIPSDLPQRDSAAYQSAVSAYREALAKLDQEWLREHTRYLEKCSQMSYSPESDPAFVLPLGYTVLGIAAVLLDLLWLKDGLSVFGVVFLVVGFVIGIRSYVLLRNHRAAHERYRRRRDRLRIEDYLPENAPAVALASTFPEGR